MSGENFSPARSRIIGLRRVSASSLVAHPGNPRLHDDAQKAIMASLLEEIGYASAIVAYDSAEFGGLTIIDGHMRKEILSDTEIDVLVVDLSDEEARLLLASHDKISSLASVDNIALSDLLAGLDIHPDLSMLFSDICHGSNDTPASMFADFQDEEKKPKYELVANFDEGYDYVLILSRRVSEFAQLASILDLPKKEYKSGRVGMSHVLDAGEFLEKWNAKK